MRFIEREISFDSTSRNRLFKFLLELPYLIRNCTIDESFRRFGVHDLLFVLLGTTFSINGTIIVKRNTLFEA